MRPFPFRLLGALITALLLVACADKTPPAGPITPTPTPTTGPLAGSPTARAGTVIPDRPYTVDPASLRTGYAPMPGVPVSVNTILIVVHDTATVARVNALLTRIQASIVGGIPGAGGSGGLLVLRLGTDTHAALAAAIATLRADPAVVFAVVDPVIAEAVVTSNGNASARWIWSDNLTEWDAGTWGLQAMRIPTLWNFDRHLPPPTRRIEVGALELGTDITHPGIAGRITRSGGNAVRSHGISVASIMAATQSRGAGIEGVLRDGEVTMEVLTDTTLHTTGGRTLFALRRLLLREPNLGAVNISLGLDLPKGFNPDTSATWKTELDDSGDFVAWLLEQVAASQPLPHIVVAAGNEAVNATYADAIANAGIRNRHAAIIVVEADRLIVAEGPTRVYRRAFFSNFNGHLSAPGTQVAVADSTPGQYRLADGTSFAAPYVTAVIAYLQRVAPDLPRPTKTTNVMRDLLVRSGVLAPAPDRADRRRIDAFAALMAIDSIRGNDRILRTWLDIDDGTLDGNLRVNPFTNAADTTEQPRADSLINMADFRRLRDAILFTDTTIVDELDGRGRIKGFDLNGNGVVQASVSENFHPYADLNGDGIVSRTATHVMPGALGSQGPLTDLQVLASRFSDSTYAPGELPELLNSGDLHLRASACTVTGTDKVRIQALRVGTTYGKLLNFAPSDSQKILTLPVEESGTDYLVSAFRLAANNGIISRQDTLVRLRLGQDIGLTPRCGTPGVTTVSVSPNTVTVAEGGTATLTATPRNGAGVVVTGRTAVWSSRDPSIVTVDASGRVTGVSAGVATIAATVDGVTGTARVSVTASTLTVALQIVPVILSNGLLAEGFGFRAFNGVRPYQYSYPITGGRRFVNTQITVSGSGLISGFCLERCPTTPTIGVLDSAEVIVTEGNGRATRLMARIELQRNF